ncbi:MAG: hypothetical protein ACKVQJ_03505 [Pyrinomonadaceae bacterium]
MLLAPTFISTISEWAVSTSNAVIISAGRTAVEGSSDDAAPDFNRTLQDDVEKSRGIFVPAGNVSDVRVEGLAI